MSEAMNLETARAVSRAIRAERFERVGYDPKACAQRNLKGRTHYCDDDTLRFFHARILNARPECEGTVFVLVESRAADMRNTRREYAFAVFDLFGDVINDRPGAGNGYKTADKAREAATAWLAAFDPVAHYRAALAERSERAEQEAARLKEVCAAL
jgi:hypothetical protein